MNEELFDQEVSEYFKPDPELEALDHAEIMKKLEDATLIEELKVDRKWKLLNETWRRIYQQAEIKLDNIDPDNKTGIIEAQLTKAFYRNILATTLKKIRENGKAAFEQAKARGFLDKIFPHQKKDY